MAKRETFKAAADGYRPVSLLEEITDESAGGPASEAPDPVVVKPDAHITSKAGILRESVSDGLRSIQATRKPVGTSAVRSAGSVSIPKDVREHAKALAATPAKNVSYKIPVGVDEWLAVYQFRHRAEKVLKQDMIALALVRFIEQVEAEEGILAE